MDNADLPFESPRLLVARAKENLAEVDARFSEFCDTNPYEIIAELDGKTDDQVVKLKLTRPIPSILRAICSDAVNNLRHALDQAVNDAAVSLRGGKRNCYFPFGSNATDFSLIYESKRYKTIPNDLRPHLNALRPYSGGDALLHALGKLSGPNKHQVVLRMNAQGANRVHFVGTASGVEMLKPIWNPAKNELPLARVRPGGKIDSNIGFQPTIQLFEPSIEKLDLPEELGPAFLAMTTSIVEGLEHETARLLQSRTSPAHDAG